MRNLIGMLIGAAIDRKDGDSGIKGAIIGTIAQSAVKLALPLAVTYAVGWGVLHLVRKVIEMDSDDSPIDLTPPHAPAT
jgi:hypothetical protein